MNKNKKKKLRGSLSREENYSSLFLLFLEENSSTGTFFNKSLRWMQRLQSVTTAFYVKKKIGCVGSAFSLLKLRNLTSKMGDVYSAAGQTAKFFRYAWFNMLLFRVLTLSKMFLNGLRRLN